MVNRFVFYFLLLYRTIAHSEHLIDSLNHALATVPEAEKAAVYNQLSRLMMEKSSEKCKKYAESALEIAVKYNNIKEEANAYHNMGAFYFTNSQYPIALDDFRLALEKHTKIENPKGMAMAMNGIGLVYEVEANYTEALNYFEKSLRVMEQIGYEEGKAGVLNNIAKIYLNLKNYDKSLEYLNKNLKLNELTKNSEEVISCLNNISSVYVEKGEYDVPLKNYLTILNFQKEAGNKYGIAITLHNIAEIYSKQHDFKKALENYLQSLSYCKEVNNMSSTSAILSELGQLYLTRGETIKALNYVNESHEIALNLKLKNQISTNLLIFSQIYEKQGNYKQALDYFKQSKSISDSIFSQSLHEQLAQFQNKYDLFNKDREISLLRKEKEIQELFIHKQKYTLWFFITVCILFLLISILVFNRYKTKQRLFKVLKSTNIELHESNAAKDRIFSLLAHDLKNPISAIYGISHFMSSELDHIKTQELKEYLEQISTSSKGTLEVIENVMQWTLIRKGQHKHEVMEIQLNDTVNHVFQLFSTEVKKKNILLTSTVDPLITIVSDRNMINTVLRNVISNAIKFSRKNGQITVGANQKNGFWEIFITDNGVGISKENIEKILNPEKVYTTLGTSKEKGSGLGLMLCIEWLHKKEGDLTITSTEDKGTTIIIKIPTTH